MNFKSMIVAGLFTLSANSAFAATTDYSDFLSWADNVSGIITTDTYNGYDFTGSNNFVDYGNGTTLGGITYTLNNGGTFFGVTKDYNLNAAYLKSNYIEWQSGSPVSSLTITLSSYTNAIGFNFGEIHGDVGPITVTLGNGDSFTANGSSTYSFFGAISDTAFNTLTITGDPYPVIDNLSLAPAAVVPEPETYGMMLAGLALMGFVANRRKA